MPCYAPLRAYRSSLFGKKFLGRPEIVFSPRGAARGSAMMLPCGQCIGCRLEKSRQWAMRCVYESSLHEKNSFLTLTYRDEDLPKGGTLVKRDFQLFMKRLRFKYGEGIRFYMCGEYGENFGRPHYHCCLFGHDFSDKEFFKVVNEQNLFISEELNELWGKGHCVIGDVTFESAAYVARYITKKLTGELKAKYGDRLPEYADMSRRPGVGRDWYEKFKGDCFPSDFVVMRGVQMKPPRYFEKLFDEEFPDTMEQIKNLRLQKAKRSPDYNNWKRLRVKERVKRASINRLKRGYENE